MTEEISFKEKLKTLHFGKAWMPSQGQKLVDNESLKETFGEDAREISLEKTHGVGPLRWKGGQPYKQSRSDGTWEAASMKDTEVALGRTKEEGRKSY